MPINDTPNGEIPTIGGFVPMFIPNTQPRIPVFFPLAPDHQPTVPALYRLDQQEPAILTLYPVHGPEPEEGENRFQTISKTRNLIVDLLMEMEGRGVIRSDSFIWIQDYDVGVFPGVIYSNYVRMWEDETIAALAADAQAHGGGSGLPETHIGQGAYLVRWKALRLLAETNAKKGWGVYRWDTRNPTNCECMNFCLDMRKLKVPGTNKRYMVEYAPGAYAQHYDGEPGAMFFNSKQDAEKIRDRCLTEYHERNLKIVCQLTTAESKGTQ